MHDFLDMHAPRNSLNRNFWAHLCQRELKLVKRKNGPGNGRLLGCCPVAGHEMKEEGTWEMTRGLSLMKSATGHHASWCAWLCSTTGLLLPLLRVPIIWRELGELFFLSEEDVSVWGEWARKRPPFVASRWLLNAGEEQGVRRPKKKMIGMCKIDASRQLPCVSPLSFLL